MDTGAMPEPEKGAKKPPRGNVEAKTTGGPQGLGKVLSIEDIKAETLVGDIRDLLLQELRDAKNTLPWTLRGEKEQREAIDRVNTVARNLVTQVVHRVAAQGEKSIRCQVKKWQVKDGIQIQVDAIEHTENILTLCEGGKLASLIFSDPEAFEGERAPITAAPDQSRMFGGDENDGDGPVFDNTDNGDGPKKN